MARDEGQPLLVDVDIDADIAVATEQPKIFTPRRVGAAVVFVSVASLGLTVGTGIGTKRSELDVPASSDHPGSEHAKPNAPTIMKRTHLNLDAIKAGQWLTDKIGFKKATDEYWSKSSGFSDLSHLYGGDKHESFEEEALKGHGHDDLEICAARAIFGWADEDANNVYNWHEFQGSQTPAGPLGADYWWDLIYKYNTQTSGFEGNDIWNAFLHRGQHMYVKDLSKHVGKFIADGVPHLLRHYKSVAENDGGRTMYVAFIPDALSGNVIILHAKDVATDALKAKFSELEDSACPYAVALPYDVDRLDQWWNNLYVHTANLDGLPHPIPIMDAVPTFDVDEVQTFYDDQMKMHTHGATMEMHEKSVEGYTCKVFTVNFATQFSTAYQLRFVYTPDARNFDEVGRFNKYVDQQVRKTTGFNTGYSKWLDDHVGIMLRDGHSLDQLRFQLEDNNIPYHAHVTEVIGDQTAGSLWALGVSGLSIEWHGTFDYTTFHKPIGGFDFCTADTVCQPADATCYEATGESTDASGHEVAGATSVGPAPKS